MSTPQRTERALSSWHGRGVDRILPHDEAYDLLSSPANWPTGNWLREPTSTSGVASFPARCCAPSDGPGLLGLPYPEELRRRRPTLRGLPAGAGGPGQPVAGGGRGGQRAHARPAIRWPPTVPTRSASGCCRDAARRRTARRLLPVRAAGRLRRRGADDPRRRATATTMSSPGPRRGSPTPAWPTSTTSSAAPADPARTASPVCSPTPTRPASPPQPPGAHHGAALLAGRADRLRRRPGDRRPADRRRGRRVPDRDAGLGLRAAGHRRLRGGAGPSRAGLRGRLRQGAPPVRPADRSSSKGWASCSPTWPLRSPPPGR